MDEHVVKCQNTHWYRSKGKYSFTADPRQADPGEIERVGLHDCRELGCEEFHACNLLEYSLWLVRKNFGGEAGEAEG